MSTNSGIHENLVCTPHRTPEYFCGKPPPSARGEPKDPSGASLIAESFALVREPARRADGDNLDFCCIHVVPTFFDCVDIAGQQSPRCDRGLGHQRSASGTGQRLSTLLQDVVTTDVEGYAEAIVEAVSRADAGGTLIEVCSGVETVEPTVVGSAKLPCAKSVAFYAEREADRDFDVVLREMWGHHLSTMPPDVAKTKRWRSGYRR